MAEEEIRLYSHMLKERYGEIVQIVGTYLLKQFSPRAMPLICKDLKMLLKDVKPAVYTLLLQNIAEYTVSAKGYLEFSVKREKFLPLLIHPHCICYVKEKYGDIAELLVDEIFFQAVATMSSVIKKVVEKLSESTGEDYPVQKVAGIRSEFQKLAEKKLISRCPNVVLSLDEKVPIPESQLFAVPEIQLQLLEKIVSTSSESAETSKSDSTTDEENFPDKDIYWCVNIERFECCLRNEAIIEGALNAYDKKASNIVRTIIDLSEAAPFSDNKLWTPTTPPVTFHEISSHVKKVYNMDTRELTPYLVVLNEDNYSFISKVDERGGGVYVVNITKIISKLAEMTATNVVQERFGSKSSRIFRMLLMHKYMEQKQIEQLSMISPRDAKFLTYELMEQSFVSTMDIPKTPDYAPNRTVYLFYVDINAVCRMLLHHCYKAISNTIIFLGSYKKNHARLLEKKMRLDVIVSALEQSGADQEQIDEVVQMITPPEKELLEQVQKGCDKLHNSINEITNMVLLMKSYLRLSSCPKK